jgi:hypothetical protein
VGGLGYSGKGGWYHSSGDRVMIVKVNPADAVSVPSDHEFQKLRVCKYIVIGESDQVLEAPLYTASGNAYDYKPSEYGTEEFEGFEYEEDDNFEDDDIYTYDEDDDYDSDLEDDDYSDFFDLPEKLTSKTNYWYNRNIRLFH